MEYQEIIEKIKPELDKVISYLRGELAKIRTSRPSASLLEGLEVECFGKKLSLKSLGLISLSEGQELFIQPWDASYLPAIEKAIFQSSLQASVIVEKDRIRVRFPPLSEEVRKNLGRILSQKGEEAKKTVRHWRQIVWREIQEKFSEGEITEDDKYKGKNELQKLIDEYNQRIEEMVEKKKKEIIKG